MNFTTKRNGDKLVAEVMFEIEVPKHWMEFCASGDVFRSDYSGYWARGVEHDEKLGWLVLDTARGRETNRERALFVWNHLADTGIMMPLPEDWYHLDEAAAVRAYLCGVQRWGVTWDEQRDCDGRWYDRAVQLALLGEVRYG